MKRIIFESAPEYIILCVVVALAYAFIQYFRVKHPWSNRMNWVLFSLRTVLAFFIAFLLLGPIVKQIHNLFEKPVYIVLQDNSISVRETTDSVTRNQLDQSLQNIRTILSEKGYDTELQDLSGRTFEKISYSAEASDINGALKKISSKYEGRNIAGVVLVSDGLYNGGLSPLYTSFNFPINTIGVGDTSERMDVAIKNIAYNKIAYQGNKFPIRAEIQVKNIDKGSITATLSKKGRVLDKQTRNASANDLLTFDFQPTADEQGIQRYDIQVDVLPNEYNKKNNRASAFVEVVEGKKKILIVAGAPHPDIKALREVVTNNSNYELLLYIPGVSDQQASTLQPQNVDLAIFYQSPDTRGKTTTIFQNFVKSKTAMLLIFGQQTDIGAIMRNNLPIKFEATPRDFDEVTAVANAAFSPFTLSAEANTLLANYPPVSVHYGKIRLPASATPLLYQKIGSVSTEKPLLVIDQQDNRKIGLMLGEGFWRWRLNEFDRTEATASFDEIFGKLIQYLSTSDDKRKFRSYPVQQEFSDTEPVVFESQVYNELFEPIYGNTIELEITDEAGAKKNYTYVINPGNTRYQIGGLREGVYRYRSGTLVNGAREEVRGQFAVVERQIELQTLAADFNLLKKLSANTGGKFYRTSQFTDLESSLRQTEATSVIHTEESYDAVINLRWVFFLLLLLVSAEWGLRKYHGSY